MAMVFRVIKHEVIPLCGSYEVRFAAVQALGDCKRNDSLPASRHRGDLLGIEWINGKAFSRMLNKVREP